MTRIPAKTPRPMGSTDRVFPGSVKAAGSPDACGCSAAAVAPAFASVAVAEVGLAGTSLPLALLLEEGAPVDAVSVMVAESVAVAAESVAVAAGSVTCEVGSTEVERD
jgi:hypothetical protein